MEARMDVLSAISGLFSPSHHCKSGWGLKGSATSVSPLKVTSSSEVPLVTVHRR